MIPVVATVLLLWCIPAAAQSIYKCTVGGKVAYGDRPCEAGAGLEVAVPPAPEPDPDTMQRLERQKAALVAIQKERQGDETRASKRVTRAQVLEARRCAKMRLRQRWHDEDAAQALSENRTALRRKAARHRQTMAIECPG